MNRRVTWLWVGFLFSIPLWMTDQYYLHILITTGIFIIAAMSLNLLLGYTGQLSLGHVAFFGIGGYTSALVSLGFDLELSDSYTFVFPAQPVWIAFLAGIVVAGFFGWLIGKISFKVRAVPRNHTVLSPRRWHRPTRENSHSRVFFGFYSCLRRLVGPEQVSPSR